MLEERAGGMEVGDKAALEGTKEWSEEKQAEEEEEDVLVDAEMGEDEEKEMIMSMSEEVFNQFIEECTTGEEEEK